MLAETILRPEGPERISIGRENFIKTIWEWKDYSRQIIVNQEKKLGIYGRSLFKNWGFNLTSFLLLVFDDDTSFAPLLYMLDPSGSFTIYFFPESSEDNLK